MIPLYTLNPGPQIHNMETAQVKKCARKISRCAFFLNTKTEGKHGTNYDMMNGHRGDQRT